jgi:hypothetical protein
MLHPALCMMESNSVQQVTISLLVWIALCLQLLDIKYTHKIVCIFRAEQSKVPVTLILHHVLLDQLNITQNMDRKLPHHKFRIQNTKSDPTCCGNLANLPAKTIHKI